MAKFIIHSSEVVYYAVEVEADTPQEAKFKFYDEVLAYGFNLEPVDTVGFEVTEVEEVKV